MMLLVAVSVLVSSWLAFGVLGAIRDRLAERIATWLLPESQAVTFRVAFAIAALAGRLAPRRRIFLTTEHVELPHQILKKPLCWTGPAEALAELHADLDSSIRVLNPVRLVTPLLGEAILLHRHNVGACRVYLLEHAVFAVLLMVMFVRLAWMFPHLYVKKLLHVNAKNLIASREA